MPMFGYPGRVESTEEFIADIVTRVFPGSEMTWEWDGQILATQFRFRVVADDKDGTPKVFGCNISIRDEEMANLERTEACKYLIQKIKYLMQKHLSLPLDYVIPDRKDMTGIYDRNGWYDTDRMAQRREQEARFLELAAEAQRLEDERAAQRSILDTIAARAKRQMQAG